MWKFPTLNQDTIFIAAPGDVRYLRTAAIFEIEQINVRSASSKEISIYDWMVDKSENGFDDWVPAQGQIPLPIDPKCRAVICTFGERIGTPLPESFPLDAIGRHATERSRGGYGVGLPRKGADFAPNSFAITGTVFEYLAVLEASQRSAEHVPPVLLLFIGDESIHDDTELLDANFGNGRLQESARQKFKTSELRRWEGEHYLPQVEQLRHFIRYVQDQGIVPKIVADETAACREIRRFLLDKLGLRLQADERDPFKALESYSIADADIMFGRDHERRESIAQLKAAWADEKRPNALCILGGSGSGKSSLLKAGLFGDLLRPAIGGGYVGFVVLPKDLSDTVPADADQAPPRALAVLVKQALKSIDENIDCDTAIREVDKVREDLQPAKAVEMMELHLERKGPDWRLLVGIDQFEEILDQWVERENAAVWQPVIQFMLLACRSPRIALIYTLQLNRAESIATDPQLGPFWTGGGVQLLGFPHQGLRAIIESAFAFKEIRLEPQLVHELQTRIMKFAEQGDPQTQSSLLPLVSMTLHRLYHSALSRGRIKKETSSDESEQILRLEDCGENLDVEDAIATLARSAQDSVKASDETVSNLLRRLVRLRGAERELLSLPSIRMPTEATEQALAEALVKQRLLLRDSDVRIRLVHEAVIHHWPEASAWLKEERIHLDRASALAADAREWQTREFEDAFLQTAGERDVDRAADVLSWFFSVLSQSDGDNLSQSDELLRRYCLGLLSHHPSPTRVIESSKFANSHIRLASGYGATDLVKQYTEVERSSVNVRNKIGQTPLMSACWFGHSGIVKVLLSAGADVDASDEKGWRAIHSAASKGQQECLELLSAAGADVEAAGDDGWRAIHSAASNGQVECLEHLLSVGASPTSTTTTDGQTSLHLAVRNGHLLAVKRLLAETPVDPDASTLDGHSTLALAIRGGNESIVGELIATNRVDVNRISGKEGGSILHASYTPLHIAAVDGALEIGKLLLKAGSNPNLLDPRGATPLECALTDRRMEFAKMLIDNGAEIDLPDQNGQTLLHKAAIGWTGEDAKEKYNFRNVSGEIVHFLLDYGVQVDARDAQEKTPLQLAVQNRNEEIIEILLARKGAIDDAEAMAMLHLGARVGSTNVVRSFLEQGISPDCADAEGWTPLHEAAQEGHYEIIKLFIEYGCQIDPIATDPPITPLGAAAETGMLDVIQTLLTHGANILVCSAERPEPLLLAIRNVQYDAATLLLDHRLLTRDEEGSWLELARTLFSQNQQRLEAAGLPFEHPLGDRLLELSLHQ